METYRAEGIVLHTENFGDANRVVTLFTKEFGKLETNAYGCRRTKNPMSGALQMFNHLSVEISRGSKVDTIRDADIINFYGNLTADLERLGFGALFFEIVNKMTLPKIPDKKIFSLLLKVLPAINSRNPRIAALVAGCQFMEIAGIQLNFSNCIHCGKKIEGNAALSLVDGGAVCHDCENFSENILPYPEELRLTFEMISDFDWNEKTKLTFRSRQISSAEKIFLSYVHSFLGKELNSVKFLRQVYQPM